MVQMKQRTRVSDMRATAARPDRSLPDSWKENDRNRFMTNRDRGIEFLEPHKGEEHKEENQYHSN
ncbi:hypothetical protein T07_6245 [Trichinella nelsoni]|uniref:Uncharacterized protein n=1 Tax=Trichinella nelsoni TaxID=6336 RepID=A0A0V0SH30_9BILA|nr:hypothetical protein T07_6245 [Trichinella nelsoni]